MRKHPIGGPGGRGGRTSSLWRFDFNMAEAGSAHLAADEEKRSEGSSSESVSLGTTISRVKLLDTTVDTFLQKLVTAGR